MNSKKLYKQNPPNNGTLKEIGTINVNFTGKGGFDINAGGLTATDVNLNPGTPAVNGAAYTNSFAGATTTALFVMDLGKLYKQDANAGTLTEVGSLTVNAENQNGFDIGGSSNTGYSLLTVGGATKVYTINTTTGAATAGIDFPNKVKGMSVGLGF